MAKPSNAYEIPATDYRAQENGSLHDSEIQERGKKTFVFSQNISQPLPFTEIAERFQEKGFIVHTAEDNQLFLDLDNGTELFDKFKDHIAMLYGAFDIEQWASKSGNIHMVLTFDRMFSIEEKLMLQCILGSDPAKEGWTLIRYKRGLHKPIRLFQPPNEKEST